MLAAHILVTYFEPFAGRHTNTSADAAEAANMYQKGTVTTLCLPVAYGECWTTLETELRRGHYSAVLSFGEGAPITTIETVGTNMYDMSTLDERGQLAPADVIHRGGPTHTRTTIPAPLFANHLTTAGIPWRISENAGTFCCNEIVYRLGSTTLAPHTSFIHVPPVADNLHTARKHAHTVGRLAIEVVANLLKNGTAENSILNK